MNIALLLFCVVMGMIIVSCFKSKWHFTIALKEDKLQKVLEVQKKIRRNKYIIQSVVSTFFAVVVSVLVDYFRNGEIIIKDQIIFAIIFFIISLGIVFKLKKKEARK